MLEKIIREINRRMKALDLTPITLANKAGLRRDAVRDITERGKSKNPSAETLAKIAKALGCTVADLTGERPIRSAVESRGQADTVSIYELDVHVAAGMGADGDTAILASEEAGSILGAFAFPRASFREMVPGPADGVRVIAVRGDSMIPALWPGQRVMVDINDKTPSPPGIFVVWDGLALVLKRIELVVGSDPMRVRIMSDNPKYSTYERTLDEAHINGRVVGVWARM